MHESHAIANFGVRVCRLCEGPPTLAERNPHLLWKPSACCSNCSTCVRVWPISDEIRCSSTRLLIVVDRKRLAPPSFPRLIEKAGTVSSTLVCNEKVLTPDSNVF
jgi:hypothetical protein